MKNELQSALLEHLAARVKELRKKKGWAQEDFAREIDVSLSTVQRWEKKGGEPTCLARRELKRLFGKSESMVMIKVLIEIPN